MLKIAICAEEPLHLRYIAELVGREFSAQQAEIEGFLSLPALLEAVSSGVYMPDIAILDLPIGRDKVPLQGLWAVRALNQLMPHGRILLLASYRDAAGEAGERERRFFSRRSCRDQQTKAALMQAVRILEKRPQPVSLAAKSGGKTTVIALEDILYIERCGRKCRIVTAGGDHIASQRPEELLLGVEQSFVRCHQGYWVNLARISSQANNEFYLDDGSSIPMSRTYRRQARARFFAYLKE